MYLRNTFEDHDTGGDGDDEDGEDDDDDAGGYEDENSDTILWSFNLLLRISMWWRDIDLTVSLSWRMFYIVKIPLIFVHHIYFLLFAPITNPLI